MTALILTVTYKAELKEKKENTVFQEQQKEENNILWFEGCCFFPAYSMKSA